MVLIKPPVINVNKPVKVLVVFDCAAQYIGTSLNSQLLHPDLTNSLVGVVIRFRQEKVAMASDVPPSSSYENECEALRFIW